MWSEENEGIRIAKELVGFKKDLLELYEEGALDMRGIKAIGTQLRDIEMDNMEMRIKTRFSKIKTP